MSLPPEIVVPRDRQGSKLGNLIRRLSSSDEKDIVATVYAIQRVLKSVDTDVHAWAEHTEKPTNGSLSKAEMQKLYDAGYAAGVQATENMQHGSDDFLGTDGKPTWEAVALFLQRNKHRLPPRCHEFIDKMAARTVWEEKPTERMHKYMHSLFFQLGGKIT
jgi:hypothetical protein